MKTSAPFDNDDAFFWKLLKNKGWKTSDLSMWRNSKWYKENCMLMFDNSTWMMLFVNGSRTPVDVLYVEGYEIYTLNLIEYICETSHLKISEEHKKKIKEIVEDQDRSIANKLVNFIKNL